MKCSVHKTGKEKEEAEFTSIYKAYVAASLSNSSLLSEIPVSSQSL